MYKDYLQIKNNKRGKGVYTTVDIPPNVPICEFRGDMFNRSQLKHEPLQILQINNDMYLGPSGDIDDYINHSCNPTCLLHIVGNRAVLYSRFFLRKDMEITFDYSTSSTDSLDNWVMDCYCGAANCRKKISGFQTLTPPQQQDLKEKGLIPFFLNNSFIK